MAALTSWRAARRLDRRIASEHCHENVCLDEASARTENIAALIVPPVLGHILHINRDLDEEYRKIPPPDHLQFVG